MIWSLVSTENHENFKHVSLKKKKKYNTADGQVEATVHTIDIRIF